MGSNKFTQEALDALEEAIAHGALRVKYTDKEVTYRSLADMLQLRDLMRRCLGLTGTGYGRVKPVFQRDTESCDEE